MLEVKAVSKIYKLGQVDVKALNDVSLTIQRNDFLTIVGASGSGKSTLLNLLGALDQPTHGRIVLEGVDYTRLSDTELSKIRRYKIGFIFQFFNLIPTLNALENVMMPLSLVEKDKAKLERKAMRLLRKVGLTERLSHKPTQLSGGEQQRVAIARSLINDPLIILADEPTGNVDSKTGEEIIGLMRDLNKEAAQTFVVVSHDPSVTLVANRIINIKDGRIVEEV